MSAHEGAPRCCSNGLRKNSSSPPYTPLLSSGKREKTISEGHPQSPCKGAPPLCTPRSPAVCQDSYRVRRRLGADRHLGQSERRDLLRNCRLLSGRQGGKRRAGVTAVDAQSLADDGVKGGKVDVHAESQRRLEKPVRIELGLLRALKVASVIRVPYRDPLLWGRAGRAVDDAGGADGQRRQHEDRAAGEAASGPCRRRCVCWRTEATSASAR